MSIVLIVQPYFTSSSNNNNDDDTGCYDDLSNHLELYSRYFIIS